MPMYLELFHGRKIDPVTLEQEELDDWGAEGPIFLLEQNQVHSTYASHIRMMTKNGENDLWYYEDLIHYDDIFYGDYTVFYVEELPVELQARLVEYDGNKARAGRYHKNFVVVSYDLDDEEGIPLYRSEDGGWTTDLEHAAVYTKDHAQLIAQEKDFPFQEEMTPCEVHVLESAWSEAEKRVVRRRTNLVAATPN